MRDVQHDSKQFSLPALRTALTCLKMFPSDLWEEAGRVVRDTFGINSLFDKQIEALQSFCAVKRDVFVNLPTCYGKSLIFEAVPIVADILIQDQPWSYHLSKFLWRIRMYTTYACCIGFKRCSVMARSLHSTRKRGIEMNSGLS